MSLSEMTHQDASVFCEKTVSPLEMETSAYSDETVSLEVTESPITSDTDASLHGPRRGTGTLQLAIIVFYSVSGGPFGIEEAVRSAGAFFCLLGFLIAPFIWSVQEATMTAELGSAYPDASGGVAWVEEAFGQRAGYTCGFLSFVSGTADTAIYPLLFLDYVFQVVNADDLPNWIQYAACTVFAVILSYINYRGLSLVGNLTTVICFISMSPFIVALLLGLFKIQPRLWFRMPDNTDGSSTLGAILWRPFLNSLFWNLNSFDSAASFSAEVEDVYSFPRAMYWSVLLVAGSYLIPLLTVLGISDAPQSAWVDGYMASAISTVGGIWLERWLVFAAAITNIALFQAEMASDSYQVMGMATKGYLPAIFSTRSRYGTPTYGILLGLSIVLLMSVTNLESIIELLNFDYAISLLMEYAAFIKLRMSKPELHRPYRIPFGTFGCCLLMMPSFAFTLLVMGLASKYTMAFGLVSVIIPLGIFQMKRSKCVPKMYSRVSSNVAEDDVIPS
jgi:amino acid transporter